MVGEHAAQGLRALGLKLEHPTPLGRLCVFRLAYAGSLGSSTQHNVKTQQTEAILYAE